MWLQPQSSVWVHTIQSKGLLLVPWRCLGLFIIIKMWYFLALSCSLSLLLVIVSLTRPFNKIQSKPWTGMYTRGATTIGTIIPCTHIPGSVACCSRCINHYTLWQVQILFLTWTWLIAPDQSICTSFINIIFTTRL